MSIFSSYKKIFLLGFIVVILIAIPFSVYIAQQSQQTKSQAAQATTLSFEPASPSINVDEIIKLDVILNPDTGVESSPIPNQVSFVKLSISFDPSKFEAANKCLIENKKSPNTLTAVFEEPLCESGTATIALSIGADPTKVVTTKTKIATLELKAISPTNDGNSTSITFDSATQVLSIASSDQTSENVLSTRIPASVTISGEATNPGGPMLTPTSTPPDTSSPDPSTDTTTTTTPPLGGSTEITPVGLSPVCSDLGIDNVTTGTAPYSLVFTAQGNDPDGTISKVSYNFGDGPIQVLTFGGGIGTSTVSSQLSHTYNNSGNYTAYAILTDDKDNLSPQTESCTQTIIINDGTGQITPFPTLPPTGPSDNILGIGVIGVILTIIGGAILILL
jgi:hypothetical protein